MTTAEEQAQRAIEGDFGSRVLDRIISQVGGRAGAKAVFGDPVERDGVTVITVTGSAGALVVAAAAVRKARAPEAVAASGRIQ